MLFSIKPTTTNAKVFFSLNNLFGYFLEQSIDAISFDKNLFEASLRDSIWENEPTKEKFESLWNSLQRISRAKRLELSETFNTCQKISDYYSNKAIALPSVDPKVLTALAALNNHLFQDTSKLVKVIAVCGEPLQDHFNTFRDQNSNGNVCCCCGTEVLAQYRENVNDEDQWRAPYDHLLAKKIYPIFAVHPQNLLPICYTCNSKAKLAKDLLHDSSGNRRYSFFVPESGNQYVSLAIDSSIATRLAPSVSATLHSTDSIIMEKLVTWDIVYQIKNRVEGEFSSLIEKLSSDFVANDFSEFRAQLIPKANRLKNLCRLNPWNFWKYKLYEWLGNQSDAVIESVWEAMKAKQDDANAFAVYGI